jgi:hypothetical protein
MKAPPAPAGNAQSLLQAMGARVPPPQLLWPELQTQPFVCNPCADFLTMDQVGAADGIMLAALEALLNSWRAALAESALKK